MAMRLINIRAFAPGGYVYVEPAFGNQPEQLFKAESYDLKQQAKIVLQFRLANKRPRATLEETMEDIDIYTCQRLGGHKRWCRDSNKTYVEHHPQVVPRGCGTCGHRH